MFMKKMWADVIDEEIKKTFCVSEVDYNILELFIIFLISYFQTITIVVEHCAEVLDCDHVEGTTSNII
jgi:hypothetical protein